MGLDQYLHAKKYLSSAEWRPQELRDTFSKVVSLMEAEPFIRKDLGHAQVEFGVAYWRKANQIHKWFVDNVQGGDDDCGEYRVEREQLQELLDLCVELNKSKTAELAQQKLPPQEGFFFGSTEVGEYYWEDISDTIEQLTRVLAETPEEFEFYYSSSW